MSKSLLQRRTDYLKNTCLGKGILIDPDSPVHETNDHRLAMYISPRQEKYLKEDFIFYADELSRGGLKLVTVFADENLKSNEVPPKIGYDFAAIETPEKARYWLDRYTQEGDLKEEHRGWLRNVLKW